MPKKKHLLKRTENVYKANLHAHSTVSDGEWTPTKIKEIYQKEGYHIVAFSDHRVLKNHSYLTDDHFVALNAVEMDVTKVADQGVEIPFKSWRKCYHFNLYHPSADCDVQPPQLFEVASYEVIDSINQYIADRVAEGYLVSYLHPYWAMQNYEDYKNLQNLWSLEIYNHNCEIGGYYGYAPQVYDDMLRGSHGYRLMVMSTDDNHSHKDTFGGWVMVHADRLTYDDVFNALKYGDFYSSQGPELYEISVEGKMLHIRCSPVELICVYQYGRYVHISKGSNLTEATFELSGGERYIRVMIRDKNHKDANSNAYWLEQ